MNRAADKATIETDKGKTGDESDKKRKRNDLSSASDIGEHSFNLEAKEEDESIKLKYQGTKPKDKKKKRPQKSEQHETVATLDIHSFEKKFGESQKTIHAIHEQMKKLSDKIDNMISKDELEAVIKRIVEHKIDSIATKIKDDVYRSVSHRIDIVEGELHTSKIETETMTKNIKSLKSSINEKDETINKLRNEIEGTRNHNIERTDELEQYTRRNSVRLNGPGLPLEKEGEKENADQTTKLAVTILKDSMGMTVEERDIDIAHRIGVLRNQVPRPIIIKFVSRNTKIRSLKDKKTKLKGTGIYIQEDLTQLKAKVLKEARESRETESAWSRDGQLYIKLRANGRIVQIKHSEYGDWLPR